MNEENETNNIKLKDLTYEELYKNLLNSFEKYSKDNSKEALDQIKSCVNDFENYSIIKSAEKLDNSYINQLVYLQNLKLEGYSLEKIFSKPINNLNNNTNNSNVNNNSNNCNMNNTSSQQMKNNYNIPQVVQRKNSYQP